MLCVPYVEVKRQTPNERAGHPIPVTLRLFILVPYGEKYFKGDMALWADFWKFPKVVFQGSRPKDFIPRFVVSLIPGGKIWELEVRRS